jgi:hypothetical protein
MSKADSLRMMEETGVAPVSYTTLNRRLPVFAQTCFSGKHSRPHATGHAAVGPASLVLSLGLLTDAFGFPLSVAAFGGCR